MKLKIEKLFHVGLLIKGIYSFLELFAGIILLSISSYKINEFIYNLFRHELLEDPHDLVVNFIINLFWNLSPSLELLIALYLLINGAIKLGLIVALWKEKLIAYPIAMIFFSLFVIYQIYRYVLTPSWILIILTILDLIIIFLSYKEYNHLKKV